MDRTIIADNKPAKIYLNKGQEYHFCTCGRSKSQPSCDGSHVDRFYPESDCRGTGWGTVSLCLQAE